MANTIYVERVAVEKLVAAAFPSYKGKKFAIEPVTKLMLRDLNWSGGTRSQYRALSLDGKVLGSMDKWNHVHPADNKAEGAELEIPLGACVVRHSFFCGRDMGLTIYLNAEDMTPFLPKADTLSPLEMFVLHAAGHYKSSYNGRSRYQMAYEDAQWRHQYCPTTEEYNDAKQSLIIHGYLNRNGSLTIKGKNVKTR